MVQLSQPLISVLIRVVFSQPRLPKRFHCCCYRVINKINKQSALGDAYNINQPLSNIKLPTPNLNHFTYQMTQLVMIIIASDKVSKKSNNGLPLLPIFPKVIPRTMLNTTNPRTFVAFAYSLFILYSSSGTKIIILQLE